MHAFAPRPRRREDAAEELDGVVPIPRLLEELPGRTVGGVLAVLIQETGRDLGHDLASRRPELPDQQHVAVRRDRQDAGGVQGPDDLPRPGALPLLLVDADPAAAEHGS